MEIAQVITKDLIAQHNLTDMDEEYDLVSFWGRRDGEMPLKTLL
jgi:hypothetical protein